MAKAKTTKKPVAKKALKLDPQIMINTLRAELHLASENAFQCAALVDLISENLQGPQSNKYRAISILELLARQLRMTALDHIEAAELEDDNV